MTTGVEGGAVCERGSGSASGASHEPGTAVGPRVALANLGCRVNRVELDVIARELVRAGCEVVDEPEADLVVVNTCAVTGEAEAKARKAVRHAASLPRRPLVVATGCVASLFADELAALAPNVTVEPAKAHVAARALALLGVGEAGMDAPSNPAMGASADAPSRPSAPAPAAASGAGRRDAAPRPSEPLAPAPNHAVTPTGRMRPGLKIQDGCDHRCTYCIVWKARGAATSTPVADVLAGVRALVADGAREVVLTGIDLGRYEADGLDLAGLLGRVLAETPVGRVRLSSVEPAGVTPALLDLMASSGGRIAPFLHVPLQSGCDATLARMGRPYDVAAYRRVVDAARAAVPGVALACDLIVGFPGETDAEFAESLETCRDVGFAKMHVFRYSRRPGTPAASMPGQVAPEVSAERGRLMRELAARSRRAYAASLVGTPQLVLVERADRGVCGGLVDVLVDPGHRGELVEVVPHALTAAGTLDARGATRVVSSKGEAPAR